MRFLSAKVQNVAGFLASFAAAFNDLYRSSSSALLTRGVHSQTCLRGASVAHGGNGPMTTWTLVGSRTFHAATSREDAIDATVSRRPRRRGPKQLKIEKETTLME